MTMILCENKIIYIQWNVYCKPIHSLKYYFIHFYLINRKKLVKFVSFRCCVRRNMNGEPQGVLLFLFQLRYKI